MELASLPTTGVKIQLRNLYFYLCSEDPFLIPFSCGAICVGVSRQCLKNVHFQQTSSPGSMSFTWLPGPPPPTMEQQSLSAMLLLLVCCCQTAVPYPKVLLHLSAVPGLGKEQQGCGSGKWEGQSSPPLCQ